MKSIKAANSIAGSARLRTPSGQLVIYTPDGTECYRGPATSQAILEAFKEEDERIQLELLNWLRKADVLGSGFLFQPINIKQLAPKVIPRNGGLRV